MAEVKQVPAVAPENLERPRVRLLARVQFTRHYLDERRFAGAVRPENYGVLALPNGHGDVVEHDSIAALNGHVLEVDEGNGRHRLPIVRAVYFFTVMKAPAGVLKLPNVNWIP